MPVLAAGSGGVEVSTPDPVDPAAGASVADRLSRLLLLHTPLGALVRWVARIPASVHTKLLTAFLLVTALFLAMGVVSFRIITGIARESVLLDEAHRRVDSSRHIEHALAMQLNFTAMALLLRDETTIANVLRENNRFNSTLAQIEAAAPPEERTIIERIRASQDSVMTTVADIANLIRDGRIDAAMTLQLHNGYPLYTEIEKLVRQVVALEEAKMEGLRESVAAASRQAVLLLTGFLGASMLLALVLGFVISWSFILPVREAHRGLGQVARGDFGTTIVVPNRDEFGLLAARMNHMARELGKLNEEQRQTARQLGTLNLQLRQASQAKSAFLASMSHELRTPMNAILGFTELLLDGVYGEPPPALAQPLADIQTNGRHLLRLINDVLDLSKIEAGRMELNLAEYAAADVVAVVHSSLRSLAGEKGLEFVTAVPDDLPSARGDAGRLTQCLMNLAGNALKFTPQGRVEIRVEREGERLLYRVSDTGIGIAPEQLDDLFTEFRQADPTVASEFGGTGLGLSITRKFVELHGGRIWVESEPGKGSTFFFTVPVRAELVPSA
jgi:signal transduction histidine kinase